MLDVLPCYDMRMTAICFVRKIESRLRAGLVSGEGKQMDVRRVPRALADKTRAIAAMTRRWPSEGFQEREQTPHPAILRSCAGSRRCFVQTDDNDR